MNCFWSRGFEIFNVSLTKKVILTKSEAKNADKYIVIFPICKYNIISSLNFLKKLCKILFDNLKKQNFTNLLASLHFVFVKIRYNYTNYCDYYIAVWGRKYIDTFLLLSFYISIFIFCWKRCRFCNWNNLKNFEEDIFYIKVAYYTLK